MDHQDKCLSLGVSDTLRDAGDVSGHFDGPRFGDPDRVEPHRGKLINRGADGYLLFALSKHSNA